MVPVMIFLVVIVVAYVVISNMNDQRKEAKGICKTSGGSCTSPTGCTCSDDIVQPTTKVVVEIEDKDA